MEHGPFVGRTGIAAGPRSLHLRGRWRARPPRVSTVRAPSRKSTSDPVSRTCKTAAS